MRHQLPNGQIIGEYQAFTWNEIQYPENWIALATAEEKAAIGLVEVPDTVRADDRYYFDGDPTRPRDLYQLKAQRIADVKREAGSLLAPTDWKITRAAEGVKAVDAETLAARAAIRAASDANEAAVLACSSVDELAAVQFTWPQEESQPAV